MPMIIDVPRGWRTRLQMARDPGFLTAVGAVLLLCAPVLPGFSRLVVLPALLLAPGYALLRLLGQTNGMRSISVAVPVSLVLAICASLVLDVSGIRLSPVSLGLLLGAATALFLAGSYGPQLIADALGQRRRTPSGDREPAPEKLWSGAGDGPPVIGHVTDSEHDEDAFATEELDRLTDEDEATLEQVPVLSGADAQSQSRAGGEVSIPTGEEVSIRPRLPCMVVGDVRLYERREVRDLLAYLRLIVDPADEVSLRRVLNVPRRGIGHGTVKSVATMARWDHTSFAEVLARPGDVPGLSSEAVRAIEAFNELLAGLRASADAGVPVADIAEAVLERSGYLPRLQASSDLRDASRIENLKELVEVARGFDALRGQTSPPDAESAGTAPGSLADFLEQMSLVTDPRPDPGG